MLHKPVAVVGGAGPTLGVELCQLLSENNYEVVALARSHSLNQQVEVLECDLTDASQVDGAFQQIRQKGIDNRAGDICQVGIDAFQVTGVQRQTNLSSDRE